MSGLAFTTVFTAAVILPFTDGKGLPSIDTPSLRSIIEHDQIYVDKTKYLYFMLAEEPPRKYFYLRRSEGFGKSLLIDTMNEFFRGEKELFANTCIRKERPNYSWSSYPVIRLDFTELDFRNETGLRVEISDKLIKIAESCNLQNVKKGMPMAQILVTLIETLKNNTGLNVVILVDEFDSPFVRGYPEWDYPSHDVKRTLHTVLSVLKAQNNNIHFCFLTGTEDFAYRHLFSSFTALDITHKPKYDEILGFTDEDLEEHFGSYILAVARNRNQTKEKILDNIKWEESFRGKRVCNARYLIKMLT